MHLGNARTALLAWLQARVLGGRILLRVDDLDQQRCQERFVTAILDDLAWLGLNFDAASPRPSHQAAAYQQAIERLAQAGMVYECYCSRAEVRQAASAPHGAEPGRYPGRCRDLSARERQARRDAGRRPALRLRVAAGVISFRDQVLGEVDQDVDATVGDFVIRRSDGVCAYQLAVVVDDAASGVTHVLRGEDLACSTPRQILLQRLLGVATPTYAHVPLWRAPTGQRLAKRDRAGALRAARDAGADPHRIIGDLAASIGLVADGSVISASDLVSVCGRIDPPWAS